MHTVAIICEYNPFHSGHAHHIAEARKQSGADTVVGVMSGCFVQRAEPAVFPPTLRAQAAIHSGMDAVIELPVLFSCAAGQLFAEGAVRILSRIPRITHLAMGVEDDGALLKRIAAVQTDEPPIFTETLKNELQSGKSYAAALTSATTAAIETDCKETCAAALQKPNNLLAVEYLKALRHLHVSLRPVFIPRAGNGHRDTSATGTHISASAARLLLQSGEIEQLKPYLPPSDFDACIDEYKRHPINESAYNALTVHALRHSDLSRTFDAGEGLDEKLRKCAARQCRLADITAACTSKRYPLGRINRICLQALLGITAETVSLSDAAAGRLIAVKNARKDLLRDLTSVAVQNTDYAAFGSRTQRVAQIDGKAGSIWALITGRDGNAFWDRKLLTV